MTFFKPKGGSKEKLQFIYLLFVKTDIGKGIAGSINRRAVLKMKYLVSGCYFAKIFNYWLPMYLCMCVWVDMFVFIFVFG